MFNVFHIVSLTVLMFLISWDTNNTQVTSYGRTTLCGLLAGIVIGDVPTGLAIGATLELMSLGVGMYGGSSVPNYSIGAIVGTAFAVATGSGLEAGLAVGIPTAALGVQLDVLGKMAGSFFLHKAQACAETLETKKMYRWIMWGSLPRPLFLALVVLIALTAGSGAIQFLLDNMPPWLIGGLTVAGGVLPAVGFALLLRFMPFKKHFVYAMAGFILTSYLNMPMIGIAIIGFILAYLVYTQNQRFDALTATGAIAKQAEEGNYDE